MQPTNQQLQQLSSVLLTVFDYDSFVRFTRHELDIPIEHVTPVQGTRDLRSVVDHLVRYCAAEEGGLVRLVSAVHAVRENDLEVQDLATAWRDIDFDVLPLPAEHPKTIVNTYEVSIGGNVSGSTIIAGDGNTVTQVEPKHSKNMTETKERLWIFLILGLCFVALGVWAILLLSR